MAAPTIPVVDTINVQTGREEQKRMPWSPQPPILPVVVKDLPRFDEPDRTRKVRSLLREIAKYVASDSQMFMQYDNISENLMVMGPEPKLTEVATNITSAFGDYFTITRNNPNEMVLTYNANATPNNDESVWMTSNSRESFEEDEMRQTIEQFGPDGAGQGAGGGQGPAGGGGQGGKAGGSGGGGAHSNDAARRAGAASSATGQGSSGGTAEGRGYDSPFAAGGGGADGAGAGSSTGAGGIGRISTITGSSVRYAGGGGGGGTVAAVAVRGSGG